METIIRLVTEKPSKRARTSTSPVSDGSAKRMRMSTASPTKDGASIHPAIDNQTQPTPPQAEPPTSTWMGMVKESWGTLKDGLEQVAEKAAVKYSQLQGFGVHPQTMVPFDMNFQSIPEDTQHMMVTTVSAPTEYMIPTTVSLATPTMKKPPHS